jgi:hypothetical protein
MADPLPCIAQPIESDRKTATLGRAWMEVLSPGGGSQENWIADFLEFVFGGQEKQKGNLNQQVDLHVGGAPRRRLHPTLNLCFYSVFFRR